MFSIEEALIGWLPGEIGVPCFAYRPEGAPARFATVERTGGGSTAGIDSPAVTVQLWAPTKGEAERLGLAARDALLYRATGIPGVWGCSINSGPYSFPDPDSRCQRYQIYANFTTET